MDIKNIKLGMRVVARACGNITLTVMHMTAFSNGAFAIHCNDADGVERRFHPHELEPVTDGAVTDAELGAYIRECAVKHAALLEDEPQVLVTTACALVTLARRCTGDILMTVPNVTDKATGEPQGTYKIRVWREQEKVKRVDTCGWFGCQAKCADGDALCETHRKGIDSSYADESRLWRDSGVPISTADDVSVAIPITPVDDTSEI